MRPTNAVFIFAVVLLLIISPHPRLDSFTGVTADDELILAGDLASMSAALDAGADPQGGPDAAFPPLCYPVAQKFDAGVELLLARGANPDGNSNQHPLILAVVRDNLTATRILLQHGANPNIVNFHGQTALYLLAGRPDLNPQLIRMLLDAGANPNQPDRQGDTPLAVACSNDNPEAARLLLAAGADPFRENHAGQSPADLATSPELLPLPFSDLR